MTQDLVAFLRARLNEDEQTARATHSVFLAWEYDESVQEVRDLGTGNELASVRPQYGAHIARHDPARVLRDVEAKRGIVDDLVEVIRWGERKGPDYQDGVEACERTLKRLALPYADHPDYREEWRP